MTTTTPTISLVLYNSTTDATASFLSYRIQQSGPAGSSNMFLIDSAFLSDRTRLTALESLKFITNVAATYDGSGSNYSSTVASVTSLVDGMYIALSINISNAGTITLNLSSLGIRSLMKINSAGTAVNLDANDLILNRTYLFKYNLASTRWEWVSATSGDQINVTSGTTGNLVSLSSTGSLLGTLTQSLMLSQTTHSATGKITLIGTDELPVVDTASSNVLKKVLYSDLLNGVGTNLGAQIAAATAKSLPIGADLLGIADTASSNATKKVTFQQLTSQLGVFINALTAKTTLAVGDMLLLMDSGAANVSKGITMTNFWAAMGAFVAAFTSKSVPVGGDSVPLSDSAASGTIKNATLTNIYTTFGILMNALSAKTTLVAADVIELADSAASFSNKKITWANTLLSIFSSLNAPEGFLINGQINVVVASNNLTVSIKTLSGGNPSSTDVVYVRINNVVRSITSALSVTLNSGTNYFGLGATAFAAQEADLFTYLGYNTGLGSVVLGFARIAGAQSYGEFSSTNTAEKYAAISNITSIASTDYFVNVGRFAATLSASASFNWSIPSFTAINLINRPIYESRWLLYAPVITSATGTFTSVSGAGRYQIAYKKVFTDVIITITTAGSAGTAIDCPLPIAAHGLNEGTYAGRENASTGSLLVCWLSSATSIRIQKYDSTFLGASGQAPAFFATYEMG